jgi:hypothetical protein
MFEPQTRRYTLPAREDARPHQTGAILLLFIELLAHFCKKLIITVMKFALAVLVYALIGVVLGAGILLTVAGKPWFLIAAIIAYVAAFGKIGCMTH